jgi:tetratricopeptide (TPR) repeat protein
MRRALQIFETAMGNDDPRLVDYQTNQAHRLEAIGYDEEAGALLDQALALARRTLEPSSRQFAVIQMLLAGHLSTMDPPRAIAFANEAIQWYEKSKSPRELSLLYRVRSDALAALHQGEEALGDCETAHAALKQVADPDNAYALADARCRGVAYLSMEKFTEAASELERARTIMPQARSLAHRARLALAHARAKLALHAPTREVRALAEEGLKAIEAFPSTSFVKNELLSFLSTLPSSTTSQTQP